MESSATPAPSKANSAMMSTLTAHCQWKDETVRERTDYPPSSAEAKKINSLVLHTHDCPRASLKGWISSLFLLGHQVYHYLTWSSYYLSLIIIIITTTYMAQ